MHFQATDRVPVAPMLGAHAVALADIPHERACREPAAQAEALLLAVETYRPDAIFTLMDLSAEPEALGAHVEARDGERLVVTRHLSRERLDTEGLEERILTARVPVFVETVSRLRDALHDTLLIGALICGPLTAAANAIGIEALARMLRRERDVVAQLLGRLSSSCSLLARRHAEAGAHAVVVLEPVATSTILSPQDLEALLLPQLQQITRTAHEAGLLSALHVCGNCERSIPLLARSGAQILSLDASVDLPAARQAVAGSVALMGNLDVRHLLPHGSARDVREQARALTSAMGSGGGFILSTGCEVPEGTPRENISHLFPPAR